jgi:hypothetical protein
MTSFDPHFNIQLNFPSITQPQQIQYLFPLEHLTSPFGIPSVQLPALNTDQFVQTTILQDNCNNPLLTRDPVFIPCSQVVYTTPITYTEHSPQYTAISELVPDQPSPNNAVLQAAAKSRSPAASPNPSTPDVPSLASPKSPLGAGRLRKKWSEAEKKLFHNLYQNLSSQYEIIRPKLIQRKLAEHRCLVTRDQAASYLQKYRMKLKRNKED